MLIKSTQSYQKQTKSDRLCFFVAEKRFKIFTKYKSLRKSDFVRLYPTSISLKWNALDFLFYNLYEISTKINEVDILNKLIKNYNLSIEKYNKIIGQISG